MFLLVKKADIEIRIFQIPGLWILTKLSRKSCTFFVSFSLCMCLLHLFESVVLGRCDKENFPLKDHLAREENYSERRSYESALTL